MPATATLRYAALRPLLALAGPVVLSELGWMAMGTVDTIMVGQLGAAALGAVGIGSAVYYSLAIFGLGLLLGLDTLVSQAFGAGDIDDCHKSLRQGVWLAVLLAPLLMLLFWFTPELLAGLGVDPAVRQLTGPFLLAMSWGTLPLLLYAALRRYLQGIGRVRPVLFALVTANLINWGGNWVFIYGKLGFPALGVAGSGWSTCAARVYLALVLAAFVWYFDRDMGAGLFHEWPRFDGPRFRQLLGLGLPAATQVCLEVGAFGVATLMAGRLVPAALAAHQIVLNCASVTFMVPLGISSAAAVSVGQAMGRQEPALARRSGWLAVLLGAGFMSVAAGMFLLAPELILRLYTPDASVIAVGITLLALAALFQLFDGVQTVTTGALRGLGNTRTPMLINLVGYWLFGLPIGYWLCFHAGWGVAGLWLGLSLALIVIALVLLAVWTRQSRDIL